MSKKDDAIVNDDVSAEDQAAAGENETSQATEEKPRELTAREKALSEIARQNEEGYGLTREEEEEAEQEGEKRDDGEEHEEGAPEAKAEGESEEGNESDQPSAAQDPLQELGYYRKDDGKLYTKMKINGEEREVPADQIKAYLQKDIAGDHKLQQAAERERRLQHMEELVRNRESQIQQSLSQRPSQVDAEEAKKQAKAVLERIWDGDEDAAAEALAGYLQRGAQPGYDPEQLLAAAEQRTLSRIEQREREKTQEQWERAVDEGNRALMQDHPDIYEDQRLFDMVNGETARMVEAQQAGDPQYTNMTPDQMIATAASSVQEWMDSQGAGTGKGGGKKTADNQSRQQRKDNLKPIPNRLAKKPTPKQDKEVDTSPAAVVERMRKNRAVI